MSIHVTNNPEWRRPGYVYEPGPGGGYIGYRAGIIPTINWRHIDGPLLSTSDSGLHWLTLWERVQMRFGWTTVEALDRKHRRDLSENAERRTAEPVLSHSANSEGKSNV